MVFQEKAIDAGAEKRLDRFGGRVDDGLALDVETRVQHHLPPGLFSDRLKEVVKGGIILGGDGLHAGRTVHVGDRGQRGSPWLANVNDGDHVRQFGAGIDVEPAVDFFQGCLLYTSRCV